MCVTEKAKSPLMSQTPTFSHEKGENAGSISRNKKEKVRPSYADVAVKTRMSSISQ